jgi:glycosyltransferase involved in cell wall biosynthesis
MDNKPLAVACIPAFNEEGTIAKVVLQSQCYVNKVVVCDDGSSDMTAEIAERLGAIVLRHKENRGKGSALRTLFTQAIKLEPDVVVIIDADGQHDPHDIPRIIKPILSGNYDVVIGNRYSGNLKSDVPLYRQRGLAVLNWFSKVTNVKDTQNGFRAYSLKGLKVVASCESDGYSVESEQLILAQKNNLRVTEIPVAIKYKGLKNTSKKMPLTHGLGIIGFLLRKIVEERPLLFMGVPGIFSIIVGSLFGAWMLQIYAANHSITTNIALASIAFILMGLFLVSTAITLYAVSRINQKSKTEE